MTIKEYTQQLREQYGRIILSKIETAQEVNCTPTHLDDERRKGKIKSIRGSYRVKFRADEIARYIGLVA